MLSMVLCCIAMLCKEQGITVLVNVHSLLNADIDQLSLLSENLMHLKMNLQMDCMYLVVVFNIVLVMYSWLKIDATIMVSKNCPISSERIGIIFVTQ